MRLVFMGTPDFACVTLRALKQAGHEIACVYTQPPRPSGRGYALRKSPVHELAEKLNIEVRTPVSLKSADEQQSFANLNAGAAIVVAYGLLLPKPVLEAPKHGCFNVHASLLPRWRGAAPIQRAIMAGDSETGVTIMRMDEGLDTGPMIASAHTPIFPEDTAGLLHDRLALLGADKMIAALRNPANPGTPQPVDGITYANKIGKAEARIDFNRPAAEVRNHIHGLSPFPGAWLMVNGARLKVLRATLAVAAGTPGTFVDDNLTIACASGAIRLRQLQREGRGAMDADTFLRGFPVPAGTAAA